MGLLSLNRNSLQLIYYYSNSATRNVLSKSSSKMKALALSFEQAEQAYRFIKEKFDIVSQSTRLDRPLSPLSMWSWDLLFLGESHTSSLHRQLNAELINLLFRNNTVLITETGDISQVPGVAESIASTVSSWDETETKDALFDLFACLTDSYCHLVKTLLLSLEDNTFSASTFQKYLDEEEDDFNKILDEMKQERPKIADFQPIDWKAFFLVDHEVKNSDLNPADFFSLLFDKIELLMLKVEDVKTKIRELRDRCFREAVNSALKSRGSTGQDIVLVAGRMHIVNSHAQSFVQTLRDQHIRSLSLIPKQFDLGDSAMPLSENAESPQKKPFDLHKRVLNDLENIKGSKLRDVLNYIKSHQTEIEGLKEELLEQENFFGKMAFYLWPDCLRLICLDEIMKRKKNPFDG